MVREPIGSGGGRRRRSSGGHRRRRFGLQRREGMAFMKSIRVPPNSANLEEARARVFDFFKTACRAIPSVMDIYMLGDVVTPSQLRSSISAQIRKNAHVTNPKVDGTLPLDAPISLPILDRCGEDWDSCRDQMLIGAGCVFLFSVFFFRFVAELRKQFFV